MIEEAVPAAGPGELLVRVQAGLTCGTDMKMFDRGHPKLTFPTPFGHEASGDVVEVGEGVEGFQEGDRVMFPISAPCGTCSYCRINRENLCHTLMEKKLWGTFSDYIVIPSHIVSWQTYTIPERVSYAEAALLDPLASVIFSWQRVKINVPGPLVITGAGAIALMHAWIARERNFEPIFIAGRRPNRLEVFKQYGFETVIMDENLPEIIRSRTDGLGAEVVIETSGNADLWEPGIACLRGGGTFMAFAGCEEGTFTRVDVTALHYEQLTIAGSFHYDRRAVAATYTAIVSGTYPLHQLFSDTYDLPSLPEALDRLRGGEGFKFVIKP